MNKELVVKVKSLLPALAGNVTYSEVAKMFLSPGYVSQAGNIYREGLRLSRFFAVEYSIGHGWCWSFLNGIRLYVWDNNKPKLVLRREFSSYILSEIAVRRETISLVREHIKHSCDMLGLHNATDSEIEVLSESLVSELTKATQLIAEG